MLSLLLNPLNLHRTELDIILKIGTIIGIERAGYVQMDIFFCVSYVLCMFFKWEEVILAPRAILSTVFTRLSHSSNYNGENMD